jgi:xanthine dehydrogenase accessory factor
MQRILVIKAGEITNSIPPDNYTVYALMTHNYNYDLEALKNYCRLILFMSGYLAQRKSLNA